MAIKLAKRKPKWLQKIAADNVKAANKVHQARFDLVVEKLELEQRLEGINDKYGTEYVMGDMFSVTQEEEQKVIDLIEGEDDEGED
jgi:hypothetical protein